MPVVVVHARAIVVGLGIAVSVGCGGKPAPSTTPPPAAETSCERAADAIAGRLTATAFADARGEALAHAKADRTRLFESLRDGCVDDHWAADTRACYAELVEVDAPDRCVAALDEATAARFQARIDDVIAPAPGSPGAIRRAIVHLRTVDTGLAECNAYLAAVIRLVSCDRVPADLAAQTIDTVDSLESGWTTLQDPRVPADRKLGMRKACTSAADAMTQTVQQLGCP